jgi:hypothetical protein
MSTRSSRKSHSAVKQAIPAAVRPTVPVKAAVERAEPTRTFSFYGDPLFGMAIASVILLAVLAALVAMS